MNAPTEEAIARANCVPCSIRMKPCDYCNFKGEWTMYNGYTPSTDHQKRNFLDVPILQMSEEQRLTNELDTCIELYVTAIENKSTDENVSYYAKRIVAAQSELYSFQHPVECNQLPNDEVCIYEEADELLEINDWLD